MSSASDAEGAIRLERRVVETDAPLHVVEVAAAAAETREASGETFLLVHGYGCSSYMWRHWVPRLARRGRVVLVDLKGFGAAPKPDDDRYSPIDLSEAVVDLVQEMGLGRITLVGQSLGGGVTLLAAVALRDEGVGRLERLVLLAPAAYRQRLPPFVWLSHRPGLASALLRLVGPRIVVRWAMRAIVHDSSSITEDQVEEYARAWALPEGRRAAFAVGRQILPPDLEHLSGRYRDIEVPTLLLWGENDPVIPLWVGERLEREMPGARLVLLEACGHMAAEERPEASWEAVEEFLRWTGAT